MNYWHNGGREEKLRLAQNTDTDTDADVPEVGSKVLEAIKAARDEANKST